MTTASTQLLQHSERTPAARTAYAFGTYLLACVLAASVIALGLSALGLLGALASDPLRWRRSFGPVAGALPMIVAVVIVVALLPLVAALIAPGRVLLRGAGAKPADPSSYPQLFGVVSTLAARAGIPAPNVAVIDDRALGLFAVGSGPRHATIAVTSAAITLPPSELEAALAHQIARVADDELRPSTVAAALAGGLMLLFAAVGFRRRPQPDASYVSEAGYRRAREDRRQPGSADASPVVALAQLIIQLVPRILAALPPRQAPIQRVASNPNAVPKADRYASGLCRDPEALTAALRRFESQPMGGWCDDRAVAALEFVPNPHGDRDGRRPVPQPTVAERIQLLPPARAVGRASHAPTSPRELPPHGVSPAEPDLWAPRSAQPQAVDTSRSVPPPTAGYSP